MGDDNVDIAEGIRAAIEPLNPNNFINEAYVQEQVLERSATYRWDTDNIPQPQYTAPDLFTPTVDQLVERVEGMVQQNPPPTDVPVTDAVEGVAKSFEAAHYLDGLMRQLNVNPDDVPQDVREKILKQGSKSWVNRVFFEWFHARDKVEVEFTPAEITLFKTIIGVKNTPAYVTAKTNIDNYENQATRYLRDANAALSMMAESRLKLIELEGSGGVDLTDQVKAIVQDGWYTFDSEKTKQWNEIHNSREMALIFKTPQIVLEYKNDAAAINVKKTFGPFHVNYFPLRAKITVSPIPDQGARCSRYFHPHVSADESICWGNADHTYSQSMRESKPRAAFLALRLILSNYNVESPFRMLQEFHDQGTELMPNDNVWVRGAYCPADLNDYVDERESDHHDETEYLVRTMYNSATERYFIFERSTGRMWPLNEDAIVEWGE